MKIVNEQSSPAPTVCLQTGSLNNIEKIKLWHLRLGHTPFNRLNIVLPDLHCNKVAQDFICTVCPLGKQIRKVFSKSSIKNTDAFQLIQIDLW